MLDVEKILDMMGLPQGEPLDHILLIENSFFVLQFGLNCWMKQNLTGNTQNHENQKQNQDQKNNKN